MNPALDALVFARAFAVQWAMGGIIQRWPVIDGRTPADGYRAAFASSLAVQLLAFAWALIDARRMRGSAASL